MCTYLKQQFFFIKIHTCEGSFKTCLPFSVACFCIPHIIKLFPWNAHFQFICPHSDSLSKPLNKALELAQKQTSVTYLSGARCSKTLSTIQVNRVGLSTFRSYFNKVCKVDGKIFWFRYSIQPYLKWARFDTALFAKRSVWRLFLHKCHLGCLFGLFFYLEEWLAAGPSLFLLVEICGMATVPYTIEWSSCLAANQLPKSGYLPQLLPMPFTMGKQMPLPIWKKAPLPIFRILFYRQYYKNVFESYGLAFETYWIPLHEDNSEAAFDPLVLLKVSLKIGQERTSKRVLILERPLYV